MINNLVLIKKKVLSVSEEDTVPPAGLWEAGWQRGGLVDVTPPTTPTGHAAAIAASDGQCAEASMRGCPSGEDQRQTTLPPAHTLHYATDTHTATHAHAHKLMTSATYTHWKKKKAAFMVGSDVFKG